MPLANNSSADGAGPAGSVRASAPGPANSHDQKSVLLMLSHTLALPHTLKVLDGSSPALFIFSVLRIYWFCCWCFFYGVLWSLPSFPPSFFLSFPPIFIFSIVSPFRTLYFFFAAFISSFHSAFFSYFLSSFPISLPSFPLPFPLASFLLHYFPLNMSDPYKVNCSFQ